VLRVENRQVLMHNGLQSRCPVTPAQHLDLQGTDADSHHPQSLASWPGGCRRLPTHALTFAGCTVSLCTGRAGTTVGLRFFHRARPHKCMERCEAPLGSQIGGESRNLCSIEIVGRCQASQALAKQEVRAQGIGRIQGEVAL
jgi:hypothetical protein